MNHIALRQDSYGGYGGNYGAYDDEEPVEDFFEETEMAMEEGEDINDADMTIE